MSKKSHHFLTLWPWPLTYDLEKLIRSGHYHYQCVYQIWEQSISWFLSYRVNTIAGGGRRAAGGGRLRRKTITSPDPIGGYNNRTPLLCYVKLCASFHSHPWIQNGVTVRKRHIWVKIGDFFCPVWPWPLTSDLDVLHGYHFCHCNHSWKFHDNTIMRT